MLLFNFNKSFECTLHSNEFPCSLILMTSQIMLFLFNTYMFTNHYHLHDCEKTVYFVANTLCQTSVNLKVLLPGNEVEQNLSAYQICINLSATKHNN